MIISCPKCSRSFQVSDTIFRDKPEGRKVRCSGCAHDWVAKPEVAASSPDPFSFVAPEITPYAAPMHDPVIYDTPVHKRAPKPRGYGARRLSWVLWFITFLVSSVFFSVLMRHHLVVKWPHLASYYRVLGVPLVVPPQTFLLRKLTWGVKKEKGKHFLRVRGEVSYKSEREVSRRVPLLHLSAYGPNTCAVQGWGSKMTQGTDVFLEKGLCIGVDWTFKITDEPAIPGEMLTFVTEKEFDPKTFDPKAVAVEFVDS